MIHGSYDPILVVLSVLIAALASYVALDLAGRLYVVVPSRARALWLGAGSVAMGLGIWSMHFVGMLAFRLPVPMAYDAWLLLLSVVVAVGASLLALAVVGRRTRIGTRTVAAAAVFMGAAIAGMHYIGMFGLRAPATIDWHPGLVALSLAVAVGASFAALRLAFALREEPDTGRALRRRAMAALVMGLSIAGMHYVGMAAARFHHAGESIAVSAPHLLATDGLALLVVVGTVATLGIALVGSAIDRRVRLTALETLAARRGEQRLRAAYDALGFGVFIVDERGVVTHANPAASAIVGVPDAEVRGRATSDLPWTLTDEHGAVLAPERFPSALVRRTGQAVRGRIYGMRDRASGGQRWLLLDAVPIRRDDGGSAETIVSFVDVTDRHVAEVRLEENAVELEMANDDLRRANEELLGATHEAERLLAIAERASRSKSDFLATMSHELRTPLNAVLGYAELLEMELAGPLTEEQRGYLRRVRAAGAHLLGLINDILDLAKIEAGRLEVARESSRIGEAVGATFTLVRPQAGVGRITLESPSPEECDLLYLGDPSRVRQILLNLLGNAVKFTEPGGRVTVSVERVEPAAEAGERGPGPTLVVRVADTGAGIPDAKHASIFEPFEQGDGGRTRTAEGAGLGLAISRRLARIMGGDLVLERSVPGEGSVFALRLPAPAAVAAAAAGDRAGAVAAQRSELGPADIGTMLLEGGIGEVVRSFADRLRADPLLEPARELAESEIEDHVATFLADLAQCLVALGRGVDAVAEYMVDGSDIQRLVSERHGAQRARLGFGEAQLRREFEILRQELEHAVRMGARGALDATVTTALATATGYLARAEHESLRGLRAVLADGSTPADDTAR